jgi:hypothetical protein
MGRKKNPYKDIKLNTTQQRVFDYLVEFGSITTLQAYVDLGETRLSARIWELRNKGVNISSEVIAVKNRFNESRHVKRYWIA